LTGNKLSKDNALTVFPDPLSPTIPSISPFFKENDTRFTALISPFGDENLTSRLLTSSKNSDIN
jgi:hypothetical protein